VLLLLLFLATPTAPGPCAETVWQGGRATHRIESDWVDGRVVRRRSRSLPDGRVAERRVYLTDAEGRPARTFVVDADGSVRFTARQFDEAGRVMSSREWRNGRLERVAESRYDVAGRLVSLTVRRGAQVRLTRYAHDDQGRVVRSWQAGAEAATTTFRYAAGRLVETHHGALQTLSAYVDGRLTERTRRRDGRWLSAERHHYDTLGRRRVVELFDESPEAPSGRRTYDYLCSGRVRADGRGDPL
jgi:hypothetical protein